MTESVSHAVCLPLSFRASPPHCSQGCLAVTRAFGDRSLQPYVIADPYISCRPVNLEQVWEEVWRRPCCFPAQLSQ